MSCGNCTNCANRCDVCINCDSGTYKGCDTAQTFCYGNKEEGQLAATYLGAAGAPDIKKDDIIIKVLPKTKWNELVAYLNEAAYLGTERPSSPMQAIPATKDFLMAEYMNSVVDLINDISGIPSPGAKVQGIADNGVGDPIKAIRMKQLMDAINGLRLKGTSCESCVSGCNVQCNTCISCDSCISCNSCQSVSSYSSHYSSHYSSP